jgi:peptidoglycan/LPS O-acetylase OafA/YrhL
MRRITELDALRGLAAVSIVIFHLWLPSYGFLGTAVDLFFVMSGYLITDIILKQREQPGFLATFYARRSLRILPIYYLSLLALLAINPALPKPYPTDALPYFLTYTQNVPHYWGEANPPFIPSFQHTWSLAVEEQYYLAWPLALVLLGRRSLRPLALALIGMAIGTRMAGFSKWILITHVDGLALGALLAALLDSEGVTSPSPRRLNGVLAGVGLGSAVFLLKGNGWVAALGPSWPNSVAYSLRMFAVNALYFSLIGLVVVHGGGRLLAPLRWSWLAGLGQLSYGIYLYHYFLFDIVQQYADRLGLGNRAAIDAIKLIAAFGISAASWRWIEKPLLSLKGRLNYRPGPEVASSMAGEPVRLDPIRSGAR